MLRAAHPTPDQLEADPPPDAVREHLEACAQCRVDRRLLRETPAEAPGAEEAAASLQPSLQWMGDAMTVSWGTSRSTEAVARSGGDEDADASLILAEGTQVGPYRVEGLLGRGGMAVVYLVRHRDLGTRHALKLLQITSPAIRGRLQREARLQARLRHPNVLAVVDTLVVGGSPALLLELARGPSLHEALREERLTLAQVDAIARQVMAGVAAAHELGLVHRDLKPANVMLDVAEDDATIVARVADFGLAKALGDDPGSTVHTRTGAVMGTPSYLAPEQLRDASRADQRADVFALGAVLFELLTGFRCFGGTDFVDITRRITEGRVPDLEALRPGVPARMRQAIAAALQVDPDDRPGDARALARVWSGDDSGAPELSDPRLAAHLLDAVVVERLPRSDGAPVALSTEPGLRTEVVRPRGVAPEVDGFVGRLAELSELDARLQPGRMLTVTGPGGMGKTRLVRRLAWTRANRFPGGVWFVHAAGARSANDLAAATAQALGLVPQDDTILQVTQVVAARGRLLLIFDNLERIAAEAGGVIARWRGAASQLAVLCTSRVRLHADGEEVIALEPMSPDEAAALFVERARRARPNFALGEGDRERLLDLVRALDGMPLAIELAAARIALVSLEELGKRMSQRFRVLAGGHDRHAALYDVLDESWNLLEPWARSALAQASVFEDGFTLPGAEGVIDLSPWPDAPWTMDVVQILVDASLVHPRRDPAAPAGAPRLELLASVREFAARRLTEAGGTEATERRHAAYFATLGRPELQHLRRTEPGLADRRALSAELADLSAACRRATAWGDHETATELLGLVSEVVNQRGPRGLARSLATDLLAGGVAGERRARVLKIAAYATRGSGDSHAAVALLREALEVAESEPLQARLHGDLGVELAEQGDLDGGRQHIERSLELSRRSGDRSSEFQALLDLGHLGFETGDLDAAIRLTEDGLALAREIGDIWRIASVLSNLGLAHGLKGDAAASIRAREEALGIARRLGDRISEASALHGIGTGLLNAGRPEEALPVLTRALKIAEEVGDATRAASLHSDVGWALADLGRYELALQSYARSIATWRQMDRPHRQVVALRNAATVHCDLRQFEQARALLQEALTVARRAGHPHGEAAVLDTLGDLAMHDGDPTAALAHYDAALPLAERSDAGLAATVRRNIASARRSSGDLEGALVAHEAVLEGHRRTSTSPSPALRARAWTLLLLDRAEDARADLEMALEHDTSPADRSFDLSLMGWALAAAGARDDAEDLFQRALELGVDDADALAFHAACQVPVAVRDGDVDRAKALAADALPRFTNAQAAAEVRFLFDRVLPRLA